jgi:hypothetical protein
MTGDPILPINEKEKLLADHDFDTESIWKPDDLKGKFDDLHSKYLMVPIIFIIAILS